MVMFPQMVKISRQKQTVTGSQSADGVWTPNNVAQEDVLYDGPADVQDVLQKDMRDLDAGPTRVANGVVFLRDESYITGIKTDDRCEITYVTGRVEQATVVDVRRLDGSVLIHRIREA